MAGAWRLLHLYRPPCAAGPSLRCAPCTASCRELRHCWPSRHDRLRCKARHSTADGRDAGQDMALAELLSEAEEEAELLPLEADGTPVWLGIVPTVDEVCEDRDWPAHVRDWRRFWGAVRNWRICLTMDVLDMDLFPTDAELEWLRLLDDKGNLRESRIAQALREVEARRDELAALGAEPPDGPIAVPHGPPGAQLPTSEELLEEVKQDLAMPSMRALTPDVLGWYFDHVAQSAGGDADEGAAAAAAAAADPVMSAAATASARPGRAAVDLEADFEEDEGEEDEGEGEGEDGAEGADEEADAERMAAIASASPEVVERAWREFTAHVAALLAEGEAAAVAEEHRVREEELPMNRLRDELMAAGEDVLAATDEAAAEALKAQIKGGKRVNTLPAELDEAEDEGYSVPPPAPERAPIVAPWESWDEWDWRAWLEKRRVRERQYAEYQYKQRQTRVLRGINVAATTDIRIMAREDWGQKPYHNYSHEEIMNSITINGYAVPPERVGLHILDPSWGADYFLEGIRYSPDGAEFLESIGRMAPADMDLLGEDADAGASTTLDESFADLDGSRPAQVPALGADGARRERDALDPPAADGADADRSARWQQPAQPALPYEEDDDDETEGLSALNN